MDAYFRIKLFFIVIGFAYFSLTLPGVVCAATLSGGNYTLNGGPTAISGSPSSGGTYTEQSTADSASGNSSGGTYTITPSPTAPASSGVNNSGATSASGSSGQSVSTSGEVPITIVVSKVRVVRASPTSVTIRFTTNSPAIGTVSYALPDGSTLTLTDSQGGTDHVFTITNLQASHTYPIAIHATSAGGQSQTYQFSVTPASIGAPGESTTPSITELSPIQSTSTLPVKMSTTSPAIPKKSTSPTWWLVLSLLILLIIGGIWFLRRLKK